MKIFLKRTLLILLCVLTVALTFLSAPVVFASRESDLKNDISDLQKQSAALENDIKRLKSEKADQKVIVDAIQKKISNTQAQIRRCNQEIEKVNSAIAKNQAEIDSRNKEIEKTKLEFKKRLRAIYMTNSQSSVNILLGAESFSDYLQLAQLTSSISAHDKKIMEEIVDTIKILNEKNEENKKLLEEQAAVKNDILKIQQQLESEENEALGIYNSIAAEQKDAEADNAQVEAQIKAKERELNKILYGGAVESFINPISGLVWPVPSCTNVTSGYGTRIHPITGKKKVHQGVDISNGSIYGKPIVAITDGEVYYVYKSCTHRSKKPICSCGGGYGNYVAIDHGKVNGEHIKAYYAHMDSVAVSNGAKVKQGQVIGYVGTTGSSTGYHLHFGVMRNGSWTNPMNYYKSTK